MSARQHDGHSVAADAGALLAAAAARLEDSNYHPEAAGARSLADKVREKAGASGDDQNGSAAEILYVRDRLAQIAYILDHDTIGRTSYPNRRAASADLRDAVEQFDQALGLEAQEDKPAAAETDSKVAAPAGPVDPAPLGSAVLLLAEAGRAGIKVTLHDDRVEVSAAAERLTASLAERLSEQQPALLQIGRAVLAGRHGCGPPLSIADQLDDDIPF